MGQYRKRPIVIEALQFRGDCVPEGIYKDDTSSTGLSIKTSYGKYDIAEGDWVVTGMLGETDVVKPDIFALTYERVKE